MGVAGSVPAFGMKKAARKAAFFIPEFYDMAQYTYQHIRIVFTGTDLV